MIRIFGVVLISALAVAVMGACEASPDAVAPLASQHSTVVVTTDTSGRSTFVSSVGDWSFTMRLSGVGGAAHSSLPSVLGVRREARQTTIVRDGIEEWFAVSGRDVEHGFSIAHAPDQRGSLAITLAVEGAAVRQASSRHVVIAVNGRDRAGYRDCYVRDAAGRAIACEIKAVPAGIALQIDAGDASFPLHVDPILFALEDKLVPSLNSTSFEYAGDALAIDGNRLLVGTSAYGAYAYERAGGQWLPDGHLDVPGVDQDALGNTVAIEGDIAVVSAQDLGDTSPNNYGGVFVFERVGPGNWGSPTLLVENSHSGQRFGSAVDIDGGRLAVGADGDDIVAGLNGAGAVYIYDRVAQGDWQLVQQLSASDAVAGDSFGRALAFSGNRLIVGAPSADSNGNNGAGAVYVFEDEGSWVEKDRLFGSSTGLSSSFGDAVALEADTILVGVDGLPPAGRAFVFEYNGTEWAETMTLLPSGAMGPAAFGFSVALSPPWAIIGAYHETVNQLDDGAVYVFERVGGVWTQSQKITASPLPNQPPHGNLFGAAVAIDAEVMVAGMPNDIVPAGASGSARIYPLVGTLCAAPGDCPTGWCIDGHCCNTACDGACDRCDVTDLEGVCTPAAGDPGSPSCAPYVCASSAACPTSCTQNNECAAGYHCVGNGCVSKKELGIACLAAGECESGHCVDGHCCDGPCIGQCQACGEAETLGSCTLVTGDPRGTRPACPADSCSEGVEATGSSCAGALSCSAPTQTACAPYACGESACRTSCTLPEHCLEGFVCDFDTNECLADGATCEGETLLQPDGSTTSCAPYRCTSSGLCLSACSYNGDCAGGYVCGSNGACAEAPSFEVESGCTFARPGREGRLDVALALLALGLVARRRRAHLATTGRG